MTRIRPILLATAAALSLGLPARRRRRGAPNPARRGSRAMPSRPRPVRRTATSRPRPRRPNAGYKPLLPNQTRAPTPSEATKVDVATVAQGLASPWALEFLPDGRMIVTEKAGKIRIVGKDGSLGQPLAGVPKVDARGQGGLLDIALSPSFASDRLDLHQLFRAPREGQRHHGGEGQARGERRLGQARRLQGHLPADADL